MMVEMQHEMQVPETTSSGGSPASPITLGLTSRM